MNRIGCKTEILFLVLKLELVIWKRAWEMPVGAESLSPDDSAQEKGDLGSSAAKKTGFCQQLENLGSRFFSEFPDKTPVWLIP